MPEKTPEISNVRKAGSLSWSLILGGLVLVIIPIAIMTPKMGSLNESAAIATGQRYAQSLVAVSATMEALPGEPKNVFVRRILPELPAFKAVDEKQITRMLDYLELVDGKLTYTP